MDILKLKLKEVNWVNVFQIVALLMTGILIGSILTSIFVLRILR